MTVADLRCDLCGVFLTGPAGLGTPGRGAVRFLYHPGNFLLKDDSGLMCDRCWSKTTEVLGTRITNRCCICGGEVEHARSLHLHESGDPLPWQFCPRDGVGFLNRLRTVEPKIDPETFLLSGDWGRAGPGGEL
jgi:hypothetical protein